MDFNQLMQEYNRLYGLYQSRQITDQAFKAAVDQLTATDAYGRFWHWDPLTNQWHRFENGQWLRDTPPIQGPPQQPAYHPPQQPAYGPPPQPGEWSAPQPGYAPPAPRPPSSNKGLWIGLSAVLGVAVIVLAVLLLTGVFKPQPPAAPTSPAQTASPAPITTPTQVKPVEPTASKAPTLTLPMPTATLPKPTSTPPGGLYPYLAPGVHYLLYATQNAMYLVQPDGSTVLLNEDDLVGPYELKVAAAPRGGRVAFMTAKDASKMTGLTLRVLRLSDRKELVAIPLTGSQSTPGPTDGPGSPAYEALNAITYNNISWSPDGQQLVFSAAIDGPSADIYILDLVTLKHKRLSSEPSQAFSARISPDGKNIVYFSATTFGTGAGFSMSGVWVVPTAGGAPVELYKPSGGGEEFVGWSSFSTFLVQSWSPVCAYYNLRQVNITTKASTSLFNSCYAFAAYDEQSDISMAATSAEIMSLCNCGKKMDPGLYNINPATTPKLVEKGNFLDVFFAEGPGFFAALNEAGKIGAYYASSQLFAWPSAAPYTIPQGNEVRLAWGGGADSGKPGLYISTDGGASTTKVFTDPVSDVAWNADFSALFFLGKDKLYVAPAPGFIPKAVLNAPAGIQLQLVIQQ